MDVAGNAIEENLNRIIQYGDAFKPEVYEDRGIKQACDQRVMSSSTPPSSSPTSYKKHFSSDAALEQSSGLSSPPSSPPEALVPSIATSRKPAFSFLKRKKSDNSHTSVHLPLSERNPNVQKPPPHRRTVKKALTQMQIDLGGDSRKTCRLCGMEYIPSIKEDSNLHKDFCGMNVAGVELGRPFLKEEALKHLITQGSRRQEKEGHLVVVDRRSSLPMKTKVKRVLEVVNAEMSAAEISDDILWEPQMLDVSEKQTFGKRKDGQQHHEKGTDRFKAFMYLIGDRCVGFCLAERITNAFSVIDDNAASKTYNNLLFSSKSSSISVSKTASIALLGISRIWTCKSYRKRGIALELLDCARDNFFYGLQIPKNLIAFSQPTESGGRLAAKWFETNADWHVYRGDI